jgi:hypothetical protein
MKIISGKKIRTAIMECQPVHVAVAFVGADWQTFICRPDLLESITFSPTLGTNPRAVADLAKVVGWDKLHLLSDLHAKIYLGSESAIIGSSNLTRNGLSGTNLREVCIQTSSAAAQEKLGRLIRQFREKADEKYPSTKAKKQRIAKLEMEWQAAISNGVLRETSTPGERTFTDFELLAEDHFYVSWYQNCDIEYSEDVKVFEHLIDDEIHFASTDPVQKHKWVLKWHITNQCLPHKTTRPRWLYIDELIEKGIAESSYEYPVCAIQRSDKLKDRPPCPFTLSKEVVAAFKKAFTQEEVARYFIQNDPYDLKLSFKGLRSLMFAMKQELGIG